MKTDSKIDGYWNVRDPAFCCLAMETSDGKACECVPLPRRCKGPCKEEKLEREFIASDGRSCAEWCKTCREARWVKLTALRRAKNPPAPTLQQLIGLIQEQAMYTQRSDNAQVARLGGELRRLQEDYTWTARRK